MRFTIEIRTKSEKFQELYQTLQGLLPAMRKEKGCQDSHIFQDVEDGEVFFLKANWEKPENLKAFMQSNSGSALLGAVDLLSEKVVVKIDNEEPKGIEVLKRMRR